MNVRQNFKNHLDAKNLIFYDFYEILIYVKFELL